MSTGVIFILGKGVTPILAYGVKSTWPQGSSAPGFSNCGKDSHDYTYRHSEHSVYYLSDDIPNDAEHPKGGAHD